MRWPTTSRPRRTHDRRASSSRIPVEFVDRGRQAAAGPATGAGRIEDQQQDLRAPGERGESMEPVGDPARLVGPGQAAAGQVEDEQVDRAAGEQRARDAQPLVEGGRGDDDQPLEPDAARDGLDRVEAARQVQPGDDRALRLRLGGHPQGERGAAARAVAADRDAGRRGQAARTEDRVERGEPGVDDPLAGERHRRRLGCQRKRTDDPRSCRTPASLEARERGVHISSGGRHRTAILEHLFYSINPRSGVGICTIHGRETTSDVVCTSAAYLVRRSVGPGSRATQQIPTSEPYASDMHTRSRGASGARSCIAEPRPGRARTAKPTTRHSPVMRSA